MILFLIDDVKGITYYYYCICCCIGFVANHL